MHAIARTVALVVLFTGLVAGCSGPASGDVAGTVTYDGIPVEKGAIQFVPADGKGPTAGGPIENGKFDVKKVPPGVAKVRITGYKEAKKQKMYDDPKADWVVTTEDYIPAKHNTESKLEYEVKPGPQTKDFTLAK
jgi:hypothetical protein